MAGAPSDLAWGGSQNDETQLIDALNNTAANAAKNSRFLALSNS
jgi:hypothetical protein